jgi:hypothetical protein
MLSRREPPFLSLLPGGWHLGGATARRQNASMKKLVLFSDSCIFVSELEDLPLPSPEKPAEQ